MMTENERELLFLVAAELLKLMSLADMTEQKDIELKMEEITREQEE